MGPILGVKWCGDLRLSSCRRGRTRKGHFDPSERLCGEEVRPFLLLKVI
jgi:hypothetical protein